MARYMVTEPVDPEPVEPIRALIPQIPQQHLGTAARQGGNVIYAKNLKIHGNQFEIHNHGMGLTGAAPAGGSTAPFSNTLIYAENLEIHDNKLEFHNHFTDPSNTKRFAAGQPRFELVSSVSGVDFGNNFIKRYYKAEKHVDEEHNLVTYTQTSSIAQSVSHALTLGLSSKRATHVLILFDACLLQEIEPNWPDRLHLKAVEDFILKLGGNYMLTRSKVKRDRFSLYLFGIKKRGDDFSQQSIQTWKDIFYWAHHLAPSIDNARISSSLSSPSSILKKAASTGIQLLAAGV